MYTCVCHVAMKRDRLLGPPWFRCPGIFIREAGRPSRLTFAEENLRLCAAKGHTGPHLTSLGHVF